MPNAAHLANAPWINAAESILLIMVIDTILISLHLYIFLPAGEHQTGMAVFLWVYIAATAYWK